MTKPFIKIHNATTNEVIEREMNDEEFAQYKIDQIAAQETIAAENAKAGVRAQLLEKLGITEEEAKLLLG